MAHYVEFTIPGRPLDRADVIFRVWRDEEMFGTLKVSKGTLVWFPANTRLGYRVDWDRFDQLMQENITTFEER